MQNRIYLGGSLWWLYIYIRGLRSKTGQTGGFELSGNISAIDQDFSVGDMTTILGTSDTSEKLSKKPTTTAWFANKQSYVRHSET